MDIFVILFQVIFAIPLFFILNYFNKKDISFIEKITIPTIYILVLSAISTEIKDNIFLIVIFEIIIRELYNNYISNKNVLVNKKEVLFKYLFSILIAIFIYDYYIDTVQFVFPKAEEFRPFLWFLVILFIYCLLKDNIKFKKIDTKEKFIIRKKEYVVVEYAKFKNNYYKLVKSKNSDINTLIYSIMIYENYKNPKLVREIRVFTDRVFNKKSRSGIMQIDSDKVLTDEDSIKYVVKDFEKKYSKSKSKSLVEDILNNEYNDQESIENVLDIYKEIKEFENK